MRHVKPRMIILDRTIPSPEKRFVEYLEKAPSSGLVRSRKDLISCTEKNNLHYTMSSHVKLGRSLWVGRNQLVCCVSRSSRTQWSSPVQPWSYSSPFNPSWRILSNPFSQGVCMSGPGADAKYKSADEKEDEENKRKGKKKKILLGGLGAGVLLGAYLGFKATQSKKSPIVNDSLEKDFILDTKPPEFSPSRQIRTETDKTGLKITLYQYQTCPFCCKARAFLDYYGLNYDVVEVNSVLRTQVKWSKYKKVPIVVVEYKDKVLQLNDSSVIVSALFSQLLDSNTSLDSIMDCYPSIRYYDEDGKEKQDTQNKYFLMYNEAKVNRTKEDIVEERRWRKWTDEVLVHTLSPNVYRSPGEALATFQWFDEVGNWPQLFQAWERYLVIYFGALVMYLIGGRLKKRHNLKDNVRESLYDECNHWLKSLKKKGTPFMGGEVPNLADLAVFGVLSAIEGCQAFKDARENTKIGDWFDLMKQAVNKREGQLHI
ncbi:prostaglandin E synthase 2 [Eurytemora carolleeae]|uniref:prostaglandin E synthase 2 n=1 Tax=Eurytemora carolleeae TaxID=1294199 RepID=UPI000C77C115|nr:prostaglandin E synthase 2 [Eurytemora carolleeae]|eukprot:XP_023322248.1 prostaglandin E synthase 2-like [Eurytemora affinis]